MNLYDYSKKTENFTFFITIFQKMYNKQRKYARKCVKIAIKIT